MKWKIEDDELMSESGKRIDLSAIAVDLILDADQSHIDATFVE
jgi:hypothetical protein